MIRLRDLPEAERARRMGVLSFDSTKRNWQVKVGGKKQIVLGRDPVQARAKWDAMMVANGHPLSPGPDFFWNANKQRWDQGERSYCKLKYGKMQGRAELCQALLLEKSRLETEIARLHIVLDKECRERRAACDAELRALRIDQRKAREAIKKEMQEFRRSELRKTKIKAVDAYEKHRRAINRKFNERRIPEVGKFQRIGRPWRDNDNGFWYAFIGIKNRKLVRLGDEEPKARVVWWILRNALNEGSRTLQKPEGFQKSLDELLEIGTDRVMARLKALGWKIERPVAVSNERESCRAT